MTRGIERLAREVRDRGGLLASAVPDEISHSPDPMARHAQLAAAGPRAEARPDEYELLFEAILEGYLLHYRGAGRVVQPADLDLALLGGDQLYALGLAKLAELGDLPAVAELADVISLVAQAQAAAAEDLAEAVWEAGATAIGWGTSPAHENAKAAARRGDPGAANQLRAAARETRRNLKPTGRN